MFTHLHVSVRIDLSTVRKGDPSLVLCRCRGIIIIIMLLLTSCWLKLGVALGVTLSCILFFVAEKATLKSCSGSILIVFWSCIASSLKNDKWWVDLIRFKERRGAFFLLVLQRRCFWRSHASVAVRLPQILGWGCWGHCGANLAHLSLVP